MSGRIAKFSNQALLWLKVKKYFPQPKVGQWILNNFNSVNDFFCSSSKQLTNLGWPNFFIKPFEDSKRFNASHLISQLNAFNIKIICIEDSNYPPLLKVIGDPPPLLLYKGDISIVFENTVSIVGSRRCSEAGKTLAYNIANMLAGNGYTVVSGLAAGIDTVAHLGAIKSGKTAGILGCGLDIYFPFSNKNLFLNMEQSGCLISEHLWGERPLRHHFPYRNRIISGLSPILIVVDAGEKSGALITANNALEQGREVLAVPGNPTESFSAGCNQLIKDGAFLIDRLEDLEVFFETKKNKQKFDSSEPIVNLLQESPKSFDELLTICELEASQLMAKITELEIKRLIAKNEKNEYFFARNYS